MAVGVDQLQSVIRREMAALGIPGVAVAVIDGEGVRTFCDGVTTVVHHGGTTHGYQADLRLVPSLGLAWVMLTNAEHHHQLDRAIQECLLGEVHTGHRGEFVRDADGAIAWFRWDGRLARRTS